MNLKTYSFLSVAANLVGPGGVVSLGAGAAVAEEGISVERDGDINTKTMGADGNGMHSLHADQSGKVTVRLLKDSPTNGILSTLYGAQTASAALHGQNVITISNLDTGDVITSEQCAFKGFPAVSYTKVGEMLVWEFDSIKINRALG